MTTRPSTSLDAHTNPLAQVPDQHAFLEPSHPRVDTPVRQVPSLAITRPSRLPRANPAPSKLSCFTRACTGQIANQRVTLLHHGRAPRNLRSLACCALNNHQASARCLLRHLKGPFVAGLCCADNGETAYATTCPPVWVRLLEPILNITTCPQQKDSTNRSSLPDPETKDSEQNLSEKEDDHTFLALAKKPILRPRTKI